MLCLDTNVVIAALKQQQPSLLARLSRALVQDRVMLSSIVLYELHNGVANSTRAAENRERLAIFLQSPIEALPFDADDAEAAGDLRAALRRAETPIGPYDLLIAAQARRRGATLVTANVAEFSSVSGLALEDWAVP